MLHVITTQSMNEKPKKRKMQLLVFPRLDSVVKPLNALELLVAEDVRNAIGGHFVTSERASIKTTTEDTAFCGFFLTTLVKVEISTKNVDNLLVSELSVLIEVIAFYKGFKRTEFEKFKFFRIEFCFYLFMFSSGG